MGVIHEQAAEKFDENILGEPDGFRVDLRGFARNLKLRVSEIVTPLLHSEELRCIYGEIDQVVSWCRQLNAENHRHRSAGRELEAAMNTLSRMGGATGAVAAEALRKAAEAKGV